MWTGLGRAEGVVGPLEGLEVGLEEDHVGWQFKFPAGTRGEGERSQSL